MLINTVVALAVFAGVVSAQTNATYIDPNSVPATLKASWCAGERNVCRLLCDKNDKTNDCDATTLSYNCTCQANNSAPALALYMNSMPYYICTESQSQCIKAHPDDQLGQDNCTSTIQSQCGKLDVANYTPSAASSAAAPSDVASPTAAPSASGSAAAPAATKASAAMAMKLGREYGSGIIAAGLVAAFGLLL